MHWTPSPQTNKQTKKKKKKTYYKNIVFSQLLIWLSLWCMYNKNSVNSKSI